MIYELRGLFKITGKGRRLIFLLILRCPFDAIQTVILASFLQFSFQAINQNNMNDLYVACVAFGIGSLVLFIYNGSVWMLYASYITRFVSILREKLFGHVSEISLQKIEEKSSGEWFTRLNADVQLAAAILSQPLHLPHAVVATVSIGVTAGILIVMNSTILVLVIVLIIPQLLISYLYIAKPMTALAMKSQEASAKNTTDMNALVTCAETALMYNAQDFLMGRFEESSLNLRKVNMTIKRRSAVGGSLLPMMGMGGYLIILLVGGSLIAAGNMTFAELLGVFQYRAGLLAGSMMLTSSFISIQTALAGVRRVNEIMNIELED